MRIIITSVGGPLAPLLTKFLKKDNQLSNIYIVGIDRRKIKKILNLDAFYTVKMKNKNYFLKKFLQICKKEQIDLIIPGSDNEALIFSKFKNRFLRNGVKILVNDYSVVKKITNKYLTYKILKKKGIKTPNFKLAKNISELKKVLKKFDYPNKDVVIKPISGTGGRGVKILKGKNSNIEKWIGKAKRVKIINNKKLIFSKNIFQYGKVMVMNILKSPAFDVDNFSYLKKSFLVIRKRINPSGIPYKGNYIIDNKKIEKYCKSISTALNLKYLTDIDLLCDNDKEPVVLEINPRPSGSSVVTYLAGIPLFSYVIATVMNKKYVMPHRFKFKFNKAINL